jgi:hypothetical protein
VDVGVQRSVARFHTPPVFANGVVPESCPPHTIIWSVPSMRVKTAECAVRALGAPSTAMGAQLSACAAQPAASAAAMAIARRSGRGP